MSKLTVIRTRHNPEQTYEEFKEARLAGFGGSDIGDLINEGDYSCKRRLFLERLNLFPEEHDSRLEFHRERGKFFEGPVAELYQKRTGREVKPCGSGYIKEFPFMRANSDRLIFGKPSFGENWPQGQVGVLEIKCPGEWMFKKIKKEGLPKQYILQLQWEMLCYGTSWGSFAIFHADSFDLQWFDVERDEGLIRGLIDEAKREWARLETLKDFLKDPEWAAKGVQEIFADSFFPGPLDPHAKPCANCEMYKECHGLDFTPTGLVLERPELEESARTFAENRECIKCLEAYNDGVKEAFKLQFRETPCDQIVAGKYKIKVSERSRESLSPKVKEILEPHELVAYMKQTTFEQVDIKEVK